MSLHENSSPAVDSRPAHRLYPSLPNVDRYGFSLLEIQKTEEKLQTAAEFPPENLLDDTQSDGTPPGSDVSPRAQILILEEQRKELLSINEKWAKEYRTMEQYYKERVRVLKSSLHRSCEDAGKHVTFNKKFKEDKENTQEGEADISSDLLKAEKEAEELRVQNRALTRRGQHQHEEIQRLNKALEEALQSSQPLGVSGGTLEDVWKQQAAVYKEDFFKERRDRERLMGKYLDLEKRFRKVHNELQVLNSQVTWKCKPQPVLQCGCANRAIKCPDWEVRPANQNQVRIHRRHTLHNEE